jgi:ParB family transcriptional regulator, chromosome partitioning protein
LSALLSDTQAAANEELSEIEINFIEPNSLQPRTNFDEEQLENLAQSIRANGIIQPLLVRRLDGGHYQLIAGERRWRAAQKAGLERVPAIIRDIPDDKILELALIENIQRQELNPIEEAQAYKRLIETLGLTQEMVAQRVGRDRTFITNYIRLLRLPEDIQRMVEQEKISMGHARALLGVDDADIQKKVAQNVINQGLSVRETERVIRKIIEGVSATPTVKTQPRSDANIRAVESKLRRRFSSQVRIINNQSGEGGKIEIEYYSENDLQRLYQLLTDSH